MALFIDGEISSLEDLKGQDSQLLDVASVEGIDVTRKVALAQDELGLELETLLGGLIREDAVFGQQPGQLLQRVVCTPALKLWHTFRTLELVYIDGYYGQLNDRYKGKRDQFHDRAQWAREKVIQTGIGMAWNPVPRAATPDLVTSPGASLPDGTYYATMAWINAAGEEGASATPGCATTDESVLVVRPATPPVVATAWNVYVGTAPGTLIQQNVEPIAPGQTWRQTKAPSTEGRGPSVGQSPSYMQPVPRVIQRG